MKNLKTIAINFLFWGNLILIGNVQSQKNDELYIKIPQKEKFVKKNFAKTYKGAQKFLDKQITYAKNLGLVTKEITPLEWWKQEYLMTMDPVIGRPTPEVLLPVVASLNGRKIAKRATPGSKNHPWKSRGPNNIGGRTRALIWDPNDTNQLRVFAGGVTGGLWVNDDISDVNSKWNLVGGIWPNLNITCIAADPNDPDIMYVGTGEGFGTTSSSSRGYGIFKTTDGGKTWSHLSNTENIYYINDIIVRNESGTSVLYVAADILYFQGAWHGNVSTVGILRSSDGGSNFTNVSPNITSQTNKYVASDFEIDASNRLWVGTRKNNYSSSSDQGGGRILYTDNGSTFVEAYKNTNALKGRVELACAPSSKDTLYAVVESGGTVQNVVRSFNGGGTWTAVTEPNDADKGIPDTDFTRGQAWYDLILTVNPVDASELVIGGINFFMSKDGASNWKQISKWSENADMNVLSCSYVHADMHAAIYSNDGQRLAVGTDGGVFYASNIRNDPWNYDYAFEERNNNYIITQYYSGSISQISPNFMLGGAQDNGTSYTLDTGLNQKRMLFGGDGGYCFIHPENDEALIFSYVNNNFYGYVYNQLYTLMQDNATGSFINPAGLDFVNDNLFTQKGQRTIYRNSITGSTSTLKTLSFISSGSDIASAFHVIKRTSNDSARLFLGTNLGRVFYSDNPQASTPTFNALGTVNSGNISAIVNLYGSEDTLALTLTNYGINNVYLSIDGGTSWTAIDGNLPNMPVWDIVLNPYNKNEAIIATELGIYQCLDIYSASPTWTPVQEGMGPVKTMMLDFNHAEGIIMATTHGRGIFTSDAWTKTDPIAFFSLTDTLVCSNSKINLIDSSLNDPTSRKWQISTSDVKFVDGTSNTSQSAFVEFTKPGKYAIKLIVEKEGIKSEISQNIEVLNNVDGAISIKANLENYCDDDTLYLNLTYADTLAPKLPNAYTKWLKNNVDITMNTNKTEFKISPPLSNGDEYYVEFTSNYKCLQPQKSKSNTITINGNKSTTLNITRDWDTLFSNYTGSGVVEWYRNGFKVGTGLRYQLYQNGSYYARVVAGNCIGQNSNSIDFNELSNAALNPEFEVFPNPSSGIIYFKSTQNEPFQFEIFTVDGRLVEKGNSKLTKELKLPQGQFIVIFTGANGLRSQRKLSVMNQTN